jgi:hypothetical protein
MKKKGSSYSCWEEHYRRGCIGRISVKGPNHQIQQDLQQRINLVRRVNRRKKKGFEFSSKNESLIYRVPEIESYEGEFLY